MLSTFACSQFSSSEVPTPTATVFATPTLAPTSTADPNVQLPPTVVGQDVSQVPLITLTPFQAPVLPTRLGTGGTTGGGSGSSGGGNGSSGGGSSGGAGGTTTAACPAGGQNLLINPGFEGEFKPFGAIGELKHAPNWFPWWRDGENNLRPEFKPATEPNRVHGGSTARQYFKSFGQFKAGVYQTVLGVPSGSRLQFSAYGQGWSCIDSSLCPNANSVDPANMLMRVGIDPSGGTDAFSDKVIWSAYFSPIDQWQIACVEAVAQADKVTVYVWASPDAPRNNQDIYWDDAQLVVVP